MSRSRITVAEVVAAQRAAIQAYRLRQIHAVAAASLRAQEPATWLGLDESGGSSGKPPESATRDR